MEQSKQTHLPYLVPFFRAMGLDVFGLGDFTKLSPSRVTKFVLANKFAWKDQLRACVLGANENTLKRLIDLAHELLPVEFQDGIPSLETPVEEPAVSGVLSVLVYFLFFLGRITFCTSPLTTLNV
jgi:hypothetical protein